MKKKTDLINKPEHYTKGIELTKYIVSWGMNWQQGNIVKYITRFPHKGTPLSDLKKARWYLNCLIREEKKKNES